MDKSMIEKYWEAVVSQNPKLMKNFFDENAYINFHNTNERFSVDEFIQVNCIYPGKWMGEIERFEQIGNLFITVVRIHNEEGDFFHAVSFINTNEAKIVSIDEYWGDDGEVPDWRLAMNVGTKIK